jgi:membrane-associated phospholipid phosphatase
LVVAIGTTLAFQGWRRGAVVWLAVVAATFVTTLICKFMFLSCSPVFGPMDVHSPSGHVAAATVVSGGLAIMLTRRRTNIIPAALLAAVVIGFSRMVLGAHSFPEVVIGALIGLAGAAALMRFAGPPPDLKLAPLVTIIAIVASLFHGLHLPAEAAIRHTALRAAQYVPACRSALDKHESAHPSTQWSVLH